MSMNHMFMEQEELAFLIAGKYVMIQECTDGYDYSLLDEEFHLIDGGVYDDQSVSITEALHVIVDDLKEHIRNEKNENEITEHELDNCFQFDAWIPVDYDELSEKAMTVENTILKEETAMSNNNVNQEMFQEFINEVIATLNKILNSNEVLYRVSVSDVNKANVNYRALNILRLEDVKGSGSFTTAPSFNLDSYYEQYRKGVSVARIAEDMVQVYKESLESREVIGNASKEIFYFEAIKERLYIRVINAERNREFLMNHPHILVGDLAIVCGIALMRLDGHDLTVSVSNNLLNCYEKQGIDFEKLYAYAKENSTKIRPYVLFKPKDVLGADVIFDEKPVDDDCVFISNEKNHEGAAVLFYDGVMQKVSELLGGSYFVLPCSMHELMCIKYQPECFLADVFDKYSAVVRDTNAEILSTDDFLSDHVYFYDASDKSFGLAKDKFSYILYQED